MSGKADVVEEAAAQEGVGELFLVVRGDDDHWSLTRRHRLTRFVNVELHPVEFLQQVIGEFDVGLVNLVDQKHNALVGGKGLPQFAALDVVGHVVNPLVTQLTVAQPTDGVIFIKALLRARCRFDVPLNQLHPQSPGHLTRQFSFAGAGFALDQQRALQRDRCIDRDGQIISCDIGIGSGEFHLYFRGFADFYRREPNVAITIRQATGCDVA